MHPYPEPSCSLWESVGRLQESGTDRDRCWRQCTSRRGPERVGPVSWISPWLPRPHVFVHPTSIHFYRNCFWWQECTREKWIYKIVKTYDSQACFVTFVKFASAAYRKIFFPYYDIYSVNKVNKINSFKLSTKILYSVHLTKKFLHKYEVISRQFNMTMLSKLLNVMTWK